MAKNMEERRRQVVAKVNSVESPAVISSHLLDHNWLTASRHA